MIIMYGGDNRIKWTTRTMRNLFFLGLISKTLYRTSFLVIYFLSYRPVIILYLEWIDVIHSLFLVLCVCALPTWSGWWCRGVWKSRAHRCRSDDGAARYWSVAPPGDPGGFHRPVARPPSFFPFRPTRSRHFSSLPHSFPHWCLLRLRHWCRLPWSHWWCHSSGSPSVYNRNPRPPLSPPHPH